MKCNCLACGYHRTLPFFNPPDQPLAALHLPASAQEARDVLSYPMNFRACANCGHIFNVEFEYARIPYEENSNLMYNAASNWRREIESLAQRVLGRYTFQERTVIDIGCGDGEFLMQLARYDGALRCVGFEPGIEARNAAKRGLEIHQDYFEPRRDLKSITPGLLVCRHVIEHLPNPREFVGEMSYWCNRYGITPLFLAEVPCIDTAVASCRINDYLYEHVSNFTARSFQLMLESCGFEVLELKTIYNDEVVVAISRPRAMPGLTQIEEQTEKCRTGFHSQKGEVQDYLRGVIASGQKVAIWGATGKGAAFMNCLDIFPDICSIVVDSDQRKVGRFVPRTGQEIFGPDFLLENPVDQIIITTQWRAHDIAEEIRARKIHCSKILVLRDGGLQEFFQ